MNHAVQHSFRILRMKNPAGVCKSAPADLPQERAQITKQKPKTSGLGGVFVDYGYAINTMYL